MALAQSGDLRVAKTHHSGERKMIFCKGLRLCWKRSHLHCSNSTHPRLFHSDSHCYGVIHHFRNVVRSYSGASDSDVVGTGPIGLS